MLQVICAGLPRTGTGSIAEALRMLGYNTLSHAPERLPLFPGPGFDFRVYDDVDAVADLPAAMYWRELLLAYPEAKVILTCRRGDEWYASIERMIDEIHCLDSTTLHNGPFVRYSDALHGLVFGNATPNPYWYKRRLYQHSEMVARNLGIMDDLGMVTEDGPLVMWFANDTEAEQNHWKPLCDFLEKPIPDVPFPWVNKGKEA